jgi:hypothetical protein
MAQPKPRVALVVTRSRWRRRSSATHGKEPGSRSGAASGASSPSRWPGYISHQTSHELYRSEPAKPNRNTGRRGDHGWLRLWLHGGMIHARRQGGCDCRHDRRDDAHGPWTMGPLRLPGVPAPGSYRPRSNRRALRRGAIRRRVLQQIGLLGVRCALAQHLDLS